LIIRHFITRFLSGSSHDKNELQNGKNTRADGKHNSAKIRTILTSGSSRSVIKSSLASHHFLSQSLVRFMPFIRLMKVFKWIRRSFVILTLYGVGLLEGYYLPPYGIGWMLAAIGATAFLAGYWMRTHWDV